MDLPEARASIREIDSQIATLMTRRMEAVKAVAQYKAAHSLPVHDPQVERQKLAELAAQVGEEMAPVIDALFPVIFNLSRSAQNRLIHGDSPLKAAIRHAIEHTDRELPARPLVACQGVEGAYSQQALGRLFPAGNTLYFNSFEKVFSAVEQGLCRYGMLPLENSTAGSVSRIYDLMMAHDFYIVRSCRVKVDHCLLANRGVRLSDIREIVSHEQAIAQCQDFLQSLPGVKVNVCANTAEAAKAVQSSGRRDLAALSSRACAELYGLDCLQDSVQDRGNNYTRFICISKQLEIYPGAHRTSLMMVLPNRVGSLYTVLSRLYALGINLIKLESRPLANSDFEFMFYFDLDTSVYAGKFLRVFDDLAGEVVSLKYLGSYTEVV
ncbi:MAG: prephenate dehydratase domain-containing protein [Eubacteriales bacterium]